MIDAVPYEVEKSIDTLLSFLEKREEKAFDEGDSQSLCGINEVIACFDNVARFLQDNGYRVPRVDQCVMVR